MLKSKSWAHENGLKLHQDSSGWTLGKGRFSTEQVVALGFSCRWFCEEQGVEHSDLYGSLPI